MRGLGAVALAVVAAVAGLGGATNEATSGSPLPATSVPRLVFESNRGQTDTRVRFLTRSHGGVVFLTAEAATFATASRAVRMRLVGASRSEPRGEARLAGRVHYFRGSSPARWVTDVPTFGRVMVPGVYRGVDLLWHGRNGLVEYDFVVHPYADPGRISLAFDGASQLRLDRGGDLVLGGGLRQLRPVAYQQDDGADTPVSARYVLRKGRVRIELGDYDRSRELVIDPQLVFSTYLGGDDREVSFNADLKVDGSGVYVAGDTLSTDFPTTPGAFEPRDRGGQDVFVTKLNRTGSALVYSTYLGGSTEDFEPKLAVGGDGSVYVAGGTLSGDFPTTPGAFQRDARNGDGFVTRLSPAGDKLVYSTYLGGGSFDRVDDLALGAGGAVYVGGATFSTDFPTTRGVFQPADPDRAHGDGFVAKLRADGSDLLYATYLGAADLDSVARVDAAGSGTVVVAGRTDSIDFPTTAGAFQSDDPDPEGGDAFVLKLDRKASALIYSTYLGASSSEFPAELVSAGDETVYVTGTTLSPDFPTTPGAFQSDDPDPDDFDVFLTKLNRSGSALVFSTYLGGNGAEHASDVVLGDRGITVAGGASSSDFPTTEDAYQRNDPDPGVFAYDAFITTLEPSGADLAYSTYLGASDYDSAWALALGGRGAFYVAGVTRSSDFPTTRRAFQRADPDPEPGPAGDDGFVTKLNPGR